MQSPPQPAHQRLTERWQHGARRADEIDIGRVETDHREPRTGGGSQSANSVLVSTALEAVSSQRTTRTASSNPGEKGSRVRNERKNVASDSRMVWRAMD